MPPAPKSFPPNAPASIVSAGVTYGQSGGLWASTQPAAPFGLALYNTSTDVTTGGVAAWTDVRFNTIPAAQLTKSADSKTITLSGGVFYVEWGISDETTEYIGLVLYLNGSMYRGSTRYAQAANGGGGQFGGQPTKWAVIDATSAAQALTFSLYVYLYTGAQLKIQRIQ